MPSYTEIVEAATAYEGYCTTCNAIIPGTFCEPDAEKYCCPDCQNNTLMGVDNALLIGELIITEDKTDD